MVDVSIIVPVYNVEKYLKKCLDTLLKIKKVSVQIICIDDVSTDYSRAILESYEGIELYTNTENMGLAYTRNRGLEIAEGEYILFVDGDDYVNSSAVEDLVEEMRLNQLDAIYFDIEEFSEDAAYIGNDIRKRKHDYPIQTGAEIFTKFVQNDEMHAAVCGGLYKRSFLMKHQMRFIQGIVHEDIPFTFELLMNASRVYVTRETVYFYRQHQKSIMNSGNNYVARVQGLLVGCSSMLVFWQNYVQKKELAECEKSFFKYMNSILSMMEDCYSKISLKDCPSGIVDAFFGNFQFKEIRRLKYMIDEKQLAELKSYSRLAIYGAGKVAGQFVVYCQENEIKIETVFVTRKNKKRKLMDIPIVEFDNKQYGCQYEAIVITVAKPTRREIEDYLLMNGYKGKIIKLEL